jgi:hypothetical protein
MNQDLHDFLIFMSLTTFVEEMSNVQSKL